MKHTNFYKLLCLIWLQITSFFKQQKFFVAFCNLRTFKCRPSMVDISIIRFFAHATSCVTCYFFIFALSVLALMELLASRKSLPILFKVLMNCWINHCNELNAYCIQMNSLFAILLSIFMVLQIIHQL